MPYIVQQTELFASWHKGLRDLKARIAIARRLDRAAAGNLGDVKSVGEGFRDVHRGGEKKTQRRDIQHAAQLAKEV